MELEGFPDIDCCGYRKAFCKNCGNQMVATGVRQTFCTECQPPRGDALRLDVVEHMQRTRELGLLPKEGDDD